MFGNGLYEDGHARCLASRNPADLSRLNLPRVYVTRKFFSGVSDLLLCTPLSHSFSLSLCVCVFARMQKAKVSWSFTPPPLRTRPRLRCEASAQGAASTSATLSSTRFAPRGRWLSLCVRVHMRARIARSCRRMASRFGFRRGRRLCA